MSNVDTAPLFKLAIVGVSGRNPIDKKRLEAKHMAWMLANSTDYIKNVLQLDPANIILVSGGSAWADHIAVQLYLTMEFAGLELYLPSVFDVKHKRYVNTHEGRALNTYHAECAEKTNIDCFTDLQRAIHGKNKAKVTVKRGFLTEKHTHRQKLPLFNSLYLRTR